MKGSQKQQDYWIDPNSIVSITHDTYQPYPKSPTSKNNGAMQISLSNGNVIFSPASSEEVAQFIWELEL